MTEALTRAFADEWGRVVASLVRITGDWALAEDAAQDAFAAAATAWERDGVPASPGAWLTTAARNRALDRLRRGATERAALPALAALREQQGEDGVEPDDVPDERLRMIFTCCHPALALETRVALTLRTLCGLTVEEIADAFGVAEPAMAKRLVRARKKIRTARIPYRVPSGTVLPERLDGVLAVLYLLFTEGYAPSRGGAVVRPDLSGEAIRLTAVLARLLPGEPEAAALLALERFQDSRRAARTAADGSPVPLDEQDRGAWDGASIEAGESALAEAERLGGGGFFLVQARIAAEHARSGAVDRRAVVRHYDDLVALTPSPHAALARAVAVGLAEGPEAGLAAIARLDGSAAALGAALPAAEADLLRRARRPAAAAYRRAVEASTNEAERAFLTRRLEDQERT